MNGHQCNATVDGADCPDKAPQQIVIHQNERVLELRNISANTA